MSHLVLVPTKREMEVFVDTLEDVRAVFCVGACGALADGLVPGDVVVATETVEHDVRKHGRPLIPRFPSDESLVARFRSVADKPRDFRVCFGPVASVTTFTKTSYGLWEI